MCGISSEIAWQFFFRFWTRFDPLLAILLVLGGTASIGEPDQKDLAKIWNLTKNHQKRKKNRIYHQNMRHFVRNRVATFFFRFWTRFDPLLAIFLVLGGRAYIGEPGQKDLAKIWNLTEKSPKGKKIELTIKMCGISSGILRQLFFRFWTRLDPLLAILLVLYSRAYVGEPG